MKKIISMILAEVSKKNKLPVPENSTLAFAEENKEPDPLEGEAGQEMQEETETPKKKRGLFGKK